MTELMDPHTLELLEFTKVRELVGSYTITSLGKELAQQIHPLHQIETLQRMINLVTEMTEAIGSKHSPPLSGISDIRLLLRRAIIGSTLTTGELNQVKEVLAATGSI